MDEDAMGWRHIIMSIFGWVFDDSLFEDMVHTSRPI